MATAMEPQVVRPAPPGPLQWVRRNLFNGWFNSLLTLITGTLLVLVVVGLVNWIFFSANWSPVVENLKLYAVGLYPSEELWRVWLIVYLISFLMGVSAGAVRGVMRTFAVALGAAYLALALAPINLEYLPMATRLRLLLNPAMVALGYLVGWKLPFRRRWLSVAWLLSFPLTLLLLSGLSNSTLLPKVQDGLWGGLLLTFLLAVVGIVASFPIGVLLALGRQSSLPVVKLCCIGFIEIVRGVPLVTILFMFSIILPLFLPADARLPRVLRAMLAMTLFAAAYMAENVRGGLQSIPNGQVEAAHAVGLNSFQTTLLIVLPQALRVVIPAIVGQFIALFMDTTLAAIVGLLELLAVGKAILNSNPQWLLLDMEVYGFIALVFWIFTFSMAYASRRVEEAVGLGKR